MSKYLILGNPYNSPVLKNSPTYRGVQRNFLPQGNEAEDAERDKAIDFFYDSISKIDSIVINNLDLAAQVCKRFNSLGNLTESFEVVELRDVAELKNIDNFFLGWDIVGVKENNSLIAEFLDSDTQSDYNVKDVDNLVTAIRANFGKLLNRNILFSQLNDALSFIGCIKENSILNPSLFTGWVLDSFKPIAVVLQKS
ncbi:MAG: hypothetical protein ACKO96_18635 [Flammeovirgaceae bacterium]